MTQLISDDYRRQNQTLHVERTLYGAGGHRWAKQVATIMVTHGLTSVLDYGCGKATLLPAVRAIMAGNGRQTGGLHAYDPAVPGRMEAPPPCQLVACTDVLEHIEPDCLDAVLAHLADLTLARCFAVIATRPAKKILPDGRNAHLIVKPPAWWLAKLRDYFKVASSTYDASRDELVVELTP